MKQVIRPGQELDIVSTEEFNGFRTEQLKLIERIIKQSRNPSVRRLDTKIESTSAAGLVVLQTTSPPPGRAWEIRRLTAAGANRTAYTLTTGLFVYNTEENPGNFLDFTTSLPAVSVWANEQLILFPGNRLIIPIVGGPASIQLAVSIFGIDWDINESPVKAD